MFRAHQLSSKFCSRVVLASAQSVRPSQQQKAKRPQDDQHRWSHAEHMGGLKVDISTSDVSKQKGAFYLTPAQVQQQLRDSNLTEQELLQQMITPASSLARPPISSYHVGAVGLGVSGAVYVGVNLEFARLPLYNSVHAEQFLVVNALHHGEQGLTMLAVSAAPCGHCRQFYSELCCADTIAVMFGRPCSTYRLSDLLPQRFGPADLMDDPTTPLLLQPQHHPLRLTAESQEKVAGMASKPSFQRAAQEALEQAARSYAPYSRCPAGAAVVTAQGEVYSGPYLESCAYNPSLSPLQTAIIDAVIVGMPCYTEVSHVVLVELKGQHVQHAPSTQVVLEQIAPNAVLTVLHAELQSS